MSDIRNIRPNGTAPEKIFRVVNGDLKEVKKSYKVMDGQLVCVWDITEEQSGVNELIMIWKNASKGVIIPPLETVAHTGIIDWGDGTKQAYVSVNEYGHRYSVDEATIKITGISSLKDGAFNAGKINPPVSLNYGYLYSVSIPESLKTIGEKCFYKYSKLEKIKLSEGITVRTDAFRDTGIKELSVPFGITAESYAFESNYNLEKLYIDCEVISYGMFSGNIALAELTIGSHVKQIDKMAFYLCRLNLQTVTIPENVESIGSGAFLECLALTSFTVLNPATVMEEEVFGNLRRRNPNLVIYGYRNSTAEQFAIENEITFSIL